MALTDYMTAEQALRKHGNAILRLAYSYLHNLADAEDVLQDTLLQFMEKTPAFQSEDHEQAWLFRVAINFSKNKLRAAWFRPPEIPETMAAAEAPEGEPAVMRAVSELPLKYSEVIHLFYYEEYSTAQIAALLHKNESTVRSLLHRARGLLKERLKGDYDFHE